MSKCIECGTSPVYISFLGKCECSNPQCKLYSKELYPPAEANTIPPPPPNHEEVDEEPRSPLYIWATHHHDFGD